MSILQIGPLTESCHQSLQQQGAVTPLWQQAAPSTFLQEQGQAFDLVITSARYGLSSEQLSALPNLQAICSFGVGYDKIDVRGARQRGILISTTPNVLTDCVADLAMGLIIDVSRGLSAMRQFAQAGRWLTDKPLLGHRVSGKRLGIVGFGRIGRAVATRAAGFSMQIGYTGPMPKADTACFYTPDICALAEWADYLVLTCPGGISTQGLVSSEVLAALGPKGYLINIARGSVVDEAALIQALHAGKIAGAGLDVYQQEPHIPAELLEYPNVVALPHIGSGTVETRQAMEDLLLQNVAEFIRARRLLTPLGD